MCQRWLRVRYIAFPGRFLKQTDSSFRRDVNPMTLTRRTNGARDGGNDSSPTRKQCIPNEYDFVDSSVKSFDGETRWWHGVAAADRSAHSRGRSGGLPGRRHVRVLQTAWRRQVIVLESIITMWTKHWRCGEDMIHSMTERKLNNNILTPLKKCAGGYASLFGEHSTY